MSRFPTTILNRQMNEDGTLTLFVHARGLDVEGEEIPRVRTDPPIDIKQVQIHTSSDGRPVTLEIHLGSGQAPGAGEAITLIFED